MANFKFVKTATAAVLGASVLTTAVLPGTDASAKTTYKVNKNGTLVNAKTNKAVNGYKSYKGILYKNGKKFTGKTKAGYYYVKGKRFTGKTKYGYYYKNGKRFTGTTKYGYYYKDGKRFNGTTKYGNLYVDGKRADGLYKGKVYNNGKKYTGVFKDKFYKNGVLNVGLYLHNGILYEGSALNEGKDLYKDALYDGSTPNKGLAVFEGKLYSDSALAKGYVTYDEKLYNEGSLFTGEKDGVEYKDGVVVKYEVTAVKAINAMEVEVKFSTDVDATTALDPKNYQIEANRDIKVTGDDLEVAYKGDSKDTVIVAVKNVSDSFLAGDKLVVSTTDGIKTADKKKSLERYTSDTINFTNSAAPTLVSGPTYKNGNLVLTFDRPVDAGELRGTGLIKVDGKEITGQLTKSTDYIPGEYIYNIPVSGDDVKEGSHDLVIYDVYELSYNNPEKAGVIAKSYTVGDDTDAPTLDSVTAVNANKFKVTFSEPVKAETGKELFEIKKGNTKFNLVADDDVTTTDDKIDATFDAINPSNGYAKSFYVVVNEDFDKSTARVLNPLYGTGETSVELTVTAQNYKDTSDLFGKLTTKTVKLSKGVTTPSSSVAKLSTEDPTDSSKTDKKLVRVVFADDINIIKESAIVVKDENGVIIDPSKYDITEESADSATFGTQETGAASIVQVKLKDSKLYSNKAYTIEFGEDSIQYATHFDKVATYNAEDAKNKAFTVKAGVADNANLKYYAGDDVVVTPATDGQSFTIDFGTEMGDSALAASNYKLDGSALPAGTKLDFYTDKKHVKVTLPAASIKSTTSYKLTISTDVKTAKDQKLVNNFQQLKEVERTFGLNDTVRPSLVGAKFIVNADDAKSSDTLLVELSEKVATASAGDFDVTVEGNKVAVDNASVVDYDGDKYLLIKLASTVKVTQEVKVAVKSDLATNKTSVTRDADNNALQAGTVTVAGKTLDRQGNSTDTVLTGVSLTPSDQVAGVIEVPAGEDTPAVKATASAQGLVFTATTAGIAGNSLKVKFVAATSANASTTAAYDGTDTVTVTLGTDSSSDINATYQDVMNAINTTSAVSDVVTVANGTATLTDLATETTSDITLADGAELVSGTPAVQEVKASTTVTATAATANGVITVSVGSDTDKVSKQVTVAKGDTAATVASKIATAFANDTKYTVINAANSADVVFTQKTAKAGKLAVVVE